MLYGMSFHVVNSLFYRILDVESYLLEKTVMI